MSETGSVKRRLETSSLDFGKTHLKRSGSVRNVDRDDRKVTEKVVSRAPRAMKPRLEAAIASRTYGNYKSTSSFLLSSARRKHYALDDEKGATDPIATKNDDKPSDEAEKREELQAIEIEKLRNKLQFVLRKTRQLEDEKSKIFQDREETMRTIENLLNQNRELSSENIMLRDQQTRDSKAIEELQKKSRILEARVAKLKEENKLLSVSNLKALKELQAMSQQKNDLNQSCRGQNVEMRRQIQEKERDLARLQQTDQRYSQLKAEYESANKQIESLRSELKRYREPADKLKTENTHLKHSKGNDSRKQGSK